MTAPALAKHLPGNQSLTREKRRVLGIACGAHTVHDGFTDLLYVMLPVWQAEFGLSYALIGVFRALYAATMAAFQVPASLLAARIGGRLVLAAGTLLAGVGYLLAGASGSVAGLCLALVLGGLGSSVQHPIAAHLVASAYADKGSRSALSTYNFSGDLGKMTLPALAALLMTFLSWRTTVTWMGALGLLAAALILLYLRPFVFNTATETPGESRGATNAAQGWSGFIPLLAIGILDSATRMGFLTFLPFVLKAKGATLPMVGLALTLVFAGGAAGKLVCGFLGARLGVLRTVWLTEIGTAATILLVLAVPLDAAMIVLPITGIALNGTSSVLYGTVPELAPDAQRQKAFGFFYTGTIGAGALSPVAYGVLGDWVGVSPAIVIVGLAVLLTLPLAWIVDRHLDS